MVSLLKCISKSKGNRSSRGNDDFKSVLEIGSESIDEPTKSNQVTSGKHKSCCKLELFVPSRILKLFHADIRMTRLEKSKYAFNYKLR